MLWTHVHQQLFSTRASTAFRTGSLCERGYNVFAQDSIPLMSTPKRGRRSPHEKKPCCPLVSPLAGAPDPILFDLTLSYGSLVPIVLTQGMTHPIVTEQNAPQIGMARKANAH